jgi:hypothetical protein
MKPVLKAPGTNLLTLKYEQALSTFAFKFYSRRYDEEEREGVEREAGAYTRPLFGSK